MRHIFGGTVADFVVIPGADGSVTLGRDKPLTFWDAKTLGNRYMDLQELGGGSISTVTSDPVTGAPPQFRGPEDVRAMWVDASPDFTGPRSLIIASDLPADVATLEARAAVLEATIAQQEGLLGAALYGLLYDAGAATYPPIPPAVAGRRLLWVGPAVPADARAGDLHLQTFE